MLAYMKFGTAVNVAGETGSILEINRDGKALFIPLRDFDPNDGFEVRLWTAVKGQVGTGYALEGSISNKGMEKAYKDSLPKAAQQNSEKKL